MSKLNRREFVKKTGAASTVFAAFTVAGTKSSRQVLGANDRRLRNVDQADLE